MSEYSYAFLTILFLCVSHLSLHVKADHDDVHVPAGVVRRDERKIVVETEFGQISAVDVSDETRGPYHIQFITLEPNSLFLPVLLHADMVFYVHTGSGRLSWADEEEMRVVDLSGGDLYRLQPGSIFYVQSNLETEREKLRIYAFFTNTENDLYRHGTGAYSSIAELVRGFDYKLLQDAFKVSEESLEEIMSAGKTPLMVHNVPSKKKSTFWEMDTRLLKSFMGEGEMAYYSNKKKKSRTYNIREADPDFENCNGWSKTVTKKNLHSLKGSNIGIFMVNLTKGSMMGPHWNPMATEVAIVLKGQGMVRVVCSSTAKKNSSECKDVSLRVDEGDVFAVNRFHPMAQMSFNNDSFVFMGFSTTTRKNHPQFLAGRSSVLQVFDREVLATSFNVSSLVIDQILSTQAESVILECTSCAEEEERLMMEEIERERQKEEERRREEEARRREEEAREREEEERKREEEEEREREEEERKREEAEERKREEEESKREREEERKRRKEEREREREEETRRRKEEEEEEREREEATRRKKEEKEERMRERGERRAREDEERESEEEERRAREHEERKIYEREEREREAEERRVREEEERKRHDREEKEREIEEEERRAKEVRRRKEEEEREEREREGEEWREGEDDKRKSHEREEEEEEARRREEEKQREEEWRRKQEEIRERGERRERRPHGKERKHEEDETEEEAARREEQERRQRVTEEAAAAAERRREGRSTEREEEPSHRWERTGMKAKNMDNDI